MEIKWNRTVTPQGVVRHEADGFLIEGIPTTSTHTGWVFGQYVNDADRVARIREWKAYTPEGKLFWTGKLKDCKRFAEARIAAAAEEAK